MNPKGLGFESSLSQLIFFQIKYAKIVKSMLKSAKSTVSDIERSSMTIFIEIMSRNRRIYACILWLNQFFHTHWIASLDVDFWAVIVRIHMLHKWNSRIFVRETENLQHFIRKNGLLAWKFFHRFSFRFLFYTQNKRTRVFGFFKKMQINFFFFEIYEFPYKKQVFLWCKVQNFNIQDWISRWLLTHI
jgi:hypothetical protein